MDALFVVGVLLLLWTVLTRLGVRGFAHPLLLLRHVPPLFGVAWLLAFFSVVSVWIIHFQPAVGLPLAPLEAFWLLCGGAWVAGYFSYGLDRAALQRLGGAWVNPFITLVTLCLLFLAIELGLRYFIAMSDSFAFSKMHQNWERLYWQPINDYGYRDNPPNTDTTRQQLLVMGDSFVTGYGVNDIANTFPHQLGRLLGESYAVNIVAVPGIGIGTALADVMRYPSRPDVLVVSHYVNDLAEGAAGRVLPPLRGLRQEPDPTLAWWVERLYMVNFYYYRLHHYFSLGAGDRYMDYLRDAYQNPDAWAIYQAEELDVLMDWTADNGVSLYVVVWCNLADCAGSADMLQPVLAYFEARNVPTLSTLTLFDAIPAQRLMVNSFDAHPSIEAHQRVSEALYALIAP